MVITCAPVKRLTSFMTKLKRLVDPRYNRIEVEHNKWYALDGKALRGIEAQGERVLLAVSHVERKTVTQKRMQGQKKWNYSGQIAKQKSPAEVSFYLSNAQVQPGDEQFQTELVTAIRQHWHIKSDNYLGKVSFQEDQVKTKEGNQGHVLASLRTLAIRLFREANIHNFRTVLDDFSDDPQYFETFLKQFGFLWESRGQTSRVEANISPLPLTITLSMGH